MALSSYLALQLAEWVGGTTMPAAPATVYVALYNAGTELTGNNYARLAISSWGDIEAGAGEMTVSNDTAVTSNAATGSNWAEATHFRLYDAATSGNALSSLTALTDPRTVTVGGVAEFPAGAFTFHMPTTDATTYLATQICEWIAGITFPAAPTSVWLAYYTTTPTELSGNGYTRGEVATWSTPDDTGTAWHTANDAIVRSGTATSSWSTATDYALFDASTSGNQLSTTEDMTTPLSITAGGYGRHTAGQIQASFPYAA